MGLKFNPTTGQLDLVGSTSASDVDAANVTYDPTYANTATFDFFTPPEDYDNAQAFVDHLIDGFVAISGQITSLGNAVTDITTNGVSLMTRPINKAGHGLVEGNVVHLSGGSESGSGEYVLSQADSKENSRVEGIVISVVDADNFVLLIWGYSEGFSGLSGSETYYLSPTTAGAMTTTEPTAPGQVVKVLGAAIGSTRIQFSPSSDSQLIEATYALTDGPDYQSSYVYVGMDTGTDWKIYRRTLATNLREYASGTSGYAAAWTGRVGLSYS